MFRSLILVVCVSACLGCHKKTTQGPIIKPSTSELFTGECFVHYENHSLDNTTGIFTDIIWDTVYTDHVLVLTDYQANNIRFVLTPQTHLVGNIKDTFSFVLNDFYTYQISKWSYESYAVSQDTLLRKVYWWNGNMPNYMTATIDFKGTK